MSSTELRQALAGLYRGTSLPPLYLRLKFLIMPFEECAHALPASGKILDVGCGYGLLANYLSLDSPRRQVVGHDTAAERIAVAQGTAAGRTNIQFVVGDARALPDRSFDAAVVTDVLHHVPYADQSPILKDLFEKLKPGGVLVVRETDKRFSLRYFLFHVVLETLLYMGVEKKRFRSIPDWTRLLESAGYQVREVRRNSPWSVYLTALFVCVRPAPAAAAAAGGAGQSTA